MDDRELHLIIRRLLAVLAALFAFVAILLLASCKTVSVTDKSVIDVEQRDSVRTVQTVSEQTTAQTTEATTAEAESTEASETTTYTFGEGGGTYNERTGEWSGLRQVTTSRTEQALRTRNAQLTEAIETQSAEITTLRDSIATLRDKTQRDTRHTESASHWWAWLLVGFAFGFITPIILKRLPYVGWLFRWM